VLGPNDPIVDQQRRTLENVAQLANIAGKAVRAQAVHGPSRQPQLAGPRDPLQQRIDQQRYVLRALAQGRQRNGEGADPVVKVLTKLPGLHHLPEVPMGRADQAEVRLLRLDAADPAEGSGFEQTQQLHLQQRRDVADLVEEQGAATGRLHQAGLARVRSGEGPPLVPEKLALEQRLGEPGALHRHEGPAPALAGLVDRPGNELLAGAGLAEQ